MAIKRYDFYITNAERLVGSFASGITVFEIDTGNVFEKKDIGWQKKYTGGARHVAPKTGGPPLGEQQITDLSAVVTLSPPVNATVAFLQSEAQNIRFTVSGANPNSTFGFLLLPGLGGEIPYAGDLNSIKFTEAAAGATLNVLYY